MLTADVDNQRTVLLFLLKKILAHWISSFASRPRTKYVEHSPTRKTFQLEQPVMLNFNPRYRLNRTPCGRSRREFLWEVGGGFAGLALIDLLSRDGFFAQQANAGDVAPYLLAPKTSHFTAKAKHAVFLFMNGAPS